LVNTKSLDIEGFEFYLDKAMKIITNYLKNISIEPVVPKIDFYQLTDLLDCDIPMESTDMDKLFDEIEGNVVANCTKIGHPRFLAWLLTSPSPAGILGEFLNVGLSQVPASFKSAPSETILEDTVIKWFAEIFGYESGYGGSLTSGGTMANMTCLAAAREKHFPGAMKKGIHGVQKPPVLYVSDQGHGCIERAASMLGFGSEAVKRVPTDSSFRIRIDSLVQQIYKDRDEGLAPFCVVAQVGSSNTGSIDPLVELANICKENGLWLHADAAYGGAAILTDEGREMLKGIQYADSIATDPHKWFFTPVEAGCCLVKNRRYLFDTFKTKDANLEDETATDYLNYGVQFTRASRAFKIWFAFRVYGLNTIAQVVKQNILLAREFAERLEKDGKWEVVAPVELSAVCFRYKDNQKKNLDSSVQDKIVKFVEESGEAFLTLAVLKGQTIIRACFTNHRTSSKDIDIIIDLLSKAIPKNI
jgi:aromatic-L-amino-acid decarboxylase